LVIQKITRKEDNILSSFYKMVEVADTVAVLLIVVAVVIVLILGGCSLRCSSRKDGYMRSDLWEPNIAFRRSPVDYAFKYGDLAMHNRPDLPGVLPGLPTKVPVPFADIGSHDEGLGPGAFHKLGATRRLTLGGLMDAPDWEQGNPHYFNEPQNKYHELESQLGGKGVDLWQDLRKQDEGLLWKQYGNNFDGPGQGKVYLPNDNKTRDLLRAVGDEGTRRAFSNAPGGQSWVYGAPVFNKARVGGTEADYIREDPYEKDWNEYWGMNKFHAPGE
jgi:hypothetical protein